MDWRVGGKSAKELAPHGLRHAAKTRMEGFRTPSKLMDERMGHIDGSVRTRCSHVTREMRDDLTAAPTAEWEAALDARLAMCRASPVAMLNDLLQERLRARGRTVGVNNERLAGWHVGREETRDGAAEPAVAFAGGGDQRTGV